MPHCISHVRCVRALGTERAQPQPTSLTLPRAVLRLVTCRGVTRLASLRHHLILPLSPSPFRFLFASPPRLDIANRRPCLAGSLKTRRPTPLACAASN